MTDAKKEIVVGCSFNEAACEQAEERECRLVD